MSIKCRYFNSGYCKYRQKRKFSHPNNICKEINCEKENCPKRHPKACKYQKGANGCWRGNSCDYAHDTLVAGDANGVKFGCFSCKHEHHKYKGQLVAIGILFLGSALPQ